MPGPLVPENGESAGMTDSQLAAAAGLTESQIVAFRNGTPWWRIGDRETLRKLAVAVGSTYDELRVAYARALNNQSARGLHRFANAGQFDQGLTE